MAARVQLRRMRRGDWKLGGWEKNRPCCRTVMQWIFIYLACADARLRWQSDEVCATARAGRPICSGLVERCGECGGFHAGKPAMAVVQQDRYGLPEPCGGEDQVDGVIAVDVACFDAETTRRRDELHGLSARRGELILNPVGTGSGCAATRLNAGQVQAAVAIKIGNCDRQAGPGRKRWATMNSRSFRGAATRRKRKQREEQAKQYAGGLADIAGVKWKAGFANELSHNGLPGAGTFGDYNILEGRRKAQAA